MINTIVMSYAYSIVVIPAKAGIQKKKNWIPCQVRLEPEPIRHHYVTIDGREFPIKQAVAEGVVKGLDRLDLTTAFARRVFQRLGFTVGRR